MGDEAKVAAELKAFERITKPVIYKAEDGQTVEMAIVHVRRMFAHGKVGDITDVECLIFMKLCEARRLNPFNGEAWLVKYGQDPAATIVAAVVYDRRADGHEDYEGCESGVWVRKSSAEPVQRQGAILFPGEELLGGWSITYRKGRRPTRADVSLKDFEQFRKNDKGEWELTKFWKTKAPLMIEKVAISTSKRRAFARLLGDTLTSEEVGGGDRHIDAEVRTVEEAPEIEEDAVSSLKAQIAQVLEAADLKEEQITEFKAAADTINTESALRVLLDQFSKLKPKGENQVEGTATDQRDLDLEQEGGK